MLISCTSCNSKYLINSADLSPKGRTVQCAKCGNQWYQEKDIIEKEEILTRSTPSVSLENKNLEESQSKKTPNLPSTYVEEQKASMINSILVLLFIILLITSFFLFKNLEINTLVLLKYYIDEFYFNLKLIFNDIAKIIYQILN